VQALLVDFNCVQRCQGFVTPVAVGCGPITSSRIGRRLVSMPREQQPRTSHLRANADPYIAE
jgi:5,10-methylene-tetrahydrofolate dehydrogenase/methenyl tetrahydrofolate cyclohydrolase